MAEDPIYDAVVIGGGVIGCAVLRELSRYRMKLLLIEKNADIGEGISKANSGVIHAGFNVPAGTLKARMNVAGLNRIYGLAEELGVPHRKTGKLVIARDLAGKSRLEQLKVQGDANGSPGLEIVDAEQIRRLEPLAAGKWALWSPNTGIVSPFLFTTALAECAVQNGARVMLESPVHNVNRRGNIFVIDTPRRTFRSRWVINCAGLFSDNVARMVGITDYRIFPYRGEYLVTDKDDHLNLRMPIYPVPPEEGAGLGVHITPTVEGNVLLGPSAESISDKTDTGATRGVMEQLKAEAWDLMPELRRLPFIRSFAGIRPKLVVPAGDPIFKDFLIEEAPGMPGWINCIGIESPGLTSAPAIAAHVTDLIGMSERLELKSDFRPEVPLKIRFAELNDEERRRLVAEDADWGEMVCRCETVTRKEVERALDDQFGVPTLDGIKRRARCGAGRCQGSFCTPRIVDILRSRGFDVSKLTKRGEGSNLFFGAVKK